MLVLEWACDESWPSHVGEENLYSLILLVDMNEKNEDSVVHFPRIPSDT